MSLDLRPGQVKEVSTFVSYFCSQHHWTEIILWSHMGLLKSSKWDPSELMLSIGDQEAFSAKQPKKTNQKMRNRPVFHLRLVGEIVMSPCEMQITWNEIILFPKQHIVPQTHFVNHSILLKHPSSGDILFLVLISVILKHTMFLVLTSSKLWYPNCFDTKCQKHTL